MTFEDIIKKFGKSLHELTDAEVKDIVEQLDATGLEKFEAAIKATTKATKPRKVSKATQDSLDAFDKILLNAEKGDS